MKTLLVIGFLHYLPMNASDEARLMHLVGAIPVEYKTQAGLHPDMETCTSFFRHIRETLAREKDKYELVGISCTELTDERAEEVEKILDTISKGQQ